MGYVLVVCLGLLLSSAGMASAEMASAEPVLDASNQTWQMVGTGYKPGTDEVLFYEYQRFLLDSEGFIVGRYIEYRLPDHSLKSVKELDYALDRSPWLPSFRYKDQEVGYEVGVDISNQQSRLYRYSERTSLEESYQALNINTIVDAGFDAYVQHVWPRLLKGEVVEFEFLAPLKLDRYAFELSFMAEENGICHLEMSLDWWLVELLIDPVQLHYDCQTRRILRYQGLTNLRDKNHKQYKADIHYQWLGEFPPFRFQ